MTTDIKFLGFSGSLRKKSYNAMALRAAQAAMPAGATMKIFDIAGIPIYNDDVREQGFPESVQQFRDQIAAADGLVIVTPEYNYSVPGVLKNAIDWASRPPKQPFEGKPIAIFSASPGALGGVRAQYHLRQSFVFLNGQVLNRPEIMIGNAQTKFDEEGKLKDEPTREIIGKLMVALAEAAREHKTK